MPDTEIEDALAYRNDGSDQTQRHKQPTEEHSQQCDDINQQEATDPPGVSISLNDSDTDYEECADRQNVGRARRCRWDQREFQPHLAMPAL